MPSIFIGIDPGKKGSIVVLSNGTVTSIKMPTIKDELDYHSLYKTISDYKDQDAIIGFEKLGVIFGTGKSTAFSMGYQSGAIEMACIASGIPYVMIPAKQWQKEMFMGITTINKSGSSKLDTKAMALVAVQRLFPNVDLKFGSRSTKPHDGLVDALLIAEFLKRKYNVS